MQKNQTDRGVRSSNHSIDRFLLVTVLGWFYQDYALFCGSKRAFRQWVDSWSEQDRIRWAQQPIIHEMRLAQTMNLCLGKEDGASLRESLYHASDCGDEWKTAPADPTEQQRLQTLQALLTLQYESVQEQQTLRAGGQKDAGIQRKTVKNLVRELLLLEDRLQTLADPVLADWLAARVQGFRLVRCDPQVPIYRITPVGQTAQQMAAVQAVYEPFLDKTHTDQILDLLKLTSQRRETMVSVSEEKSPHTPGTPLPELLEQALTAAETARKAYDEGEPPEELFWYELEYHRWEWQDGQLVLSPLHKIPLLPWQVVYNNGYFYLCGLRLDLEPSVTGTEPGRQLVFSNLRLDRIRQLRQVRYSQTECDIGYTLRRIESIIQRMYQSPPCSPLEYRESSTIMYSGTPETIRIDCAASLMNTAVDAFGWKNITLEDDTLPHGWVRIQIKRAVWGGVKQWLLQHAGACCLTNCPSQTDRRHEMLQAFQTATAQYQQE